MHDRLIANLFVSFLYFFVVSQSVYANESAAGWAATSLYLKQEKSVSIEEEVLYINENKVVVSYVFRNHSDKDITTVVAFPMPDYKWEISDNAKPDPVYDDFKVEINGVQIKHQEEIRALVKNKDYTKLLNAFGLSIEDFADFDSFFRRDSSNELNRPQYYFEKLTPVQQQILLKKKLVYHEEGLGKLALPGWRVSRKYYWTQVFPAKSTISIKLSYMPIKGYDYIGGDKPINDACINSDVKHRLAGSTYAPHFTYVDYILTTANNWKQPIKSFHLIIDGHGSETDKDPSMCFEKKLNKTGPCRYEVTVPNFLPKKDITVYFFY